MQLPAASRSQRRFCAVDQPASAPRRRARSRAASRPCVANSGSVKVATQPAGSGSQSKRRHGSSISGAIGSPRARLRADAHDLDARDRAPLVRRVVALALAQVLRGARARATTWRSRGSRASARRSRPRAPGRSGRRAIATSPPIGTGAPREPGGFSRSNQSSMRGPRGAVDLAALERLPDRVAVAAVGVQRDEPAGGEERGLALRLEDLEAELLDREGARLARPAPRAAGSSMRATGLSGSSRRRATRSCRGARTPCSRCRDARSGCRDEPMKPKRKWRGAAGSSKLPSASMYCAEPPGR